LVSKEADQSNQPEAYRSDGLQNAKRRFWRGVCKMAGAGLKVKFIDGADVTRAEFFKMFGCGAMIDHIKLINGADDDLEEHIITEATILTFRWEMV